MRRQTAQRRRRGSFVANVPPVNFKRRRIFSSSGHGCGGGGGLAGRGGEFAGAGAMESRLDAGAHGVQLVRGAEEGGELRQYLPGTMHERLVADAQRVDAMAGAPALGAAQVLPVGLADVGRDAGGGGSAQPLQHGVLALENFFHVAFHKRVSPRVALGNCAFALAIQPGGV